MKLKSAVVVNDSGFVFNPETGDSFSVNAIGLEVIRCVQGGCDKKSLCTLLSKQFNIKLGLLSKDIDDFFWMLRNYKLLSDGE